jgi:hydroxyacylglutathione hydrolase
VKNWVTRKGSIINEVAVVGDAMFGVFKGSIFPPFASETRLLIDSWKTLLETGCSIFLPSHGTGNDRNMVQMEYKKYR